MSSDVSQASERFVLESFAWAGPDQLELAGRFTHLGSPPRGAPVLVLHGKQHVHRLPAVPERSSGAPQDGEPWHAAFAWNEPPKPFRSAELELGAVAVALPAPGTDGATEPKELPVRRPEPAEGVRRVGLETELLTAQEQLRELRLEAEQAQAELTRARADLDAERERRAADSERFRAGIAQVRASAEEAVAAEQTGGKQLAEELETAIAERDGLRAQVAKLETEARDAETALAGLGTVREGVEAAAADAEQLLGRMQTLRDALPRPS
jgi:hypothetical protein